jgi:hypothetical protein
MSQPSGDHFQISVGGSVGGNVVVGSGNVVGHGNVTGHHNVVGNQNSVVTANDLAEFRAAVDSLKQRMPTPEAAAQLETLHAAATAPTPDVSTMAKVRGWFATHLPTFAGAVTGLLVHPVVGALVKAAGDAVVEQFKRELPGAE